MYQHLHSTKVNQSNPLAKVFNLNTNFLQTVTGINIHITTPIICIICISYTVLGGLKAVVWTDVIQIFIMLASLIVVAVKGTISAGGFMEVIQRNLDGNRIEGPL